MPREVSYIVETRENGGRWRRMWSGQSETIACDAARGLAKETRRIEGWNRSIPIYPWVRVRHARRVVLQIGPERRES